MILPVDFSVHLCNKKYELLIMGKFINKTQFTSLARMSLFVAHFYKMFCYYYYYIYLLSMYHVQVLQT